MRDDAKRQKREREVTSTPAQIESIAAVICHAEFPTPRDDTPAEYWETVAELWKGGYCLSAKRVLSRWMNPDLVRAKLVDDVAHCLRRNDSVMPSLACKAKADEIVTVIIRRLATWDANDG